MPCDARLWDLDQHDNEDSSFKFSKELTPFGKCSIITPWREPGLASQKNHRSSPGLQWDEKSTVDGRDILGKRALSVFIKCCPWSWLVNVHLSETPFTPIRIQINDSCFIYPNPIAKKTNPIFPVDKKLNRSFPIHPICSSLLFGWLSILCTHAVRLMEPWCLRQLNTSTFLITG